MKFKFRGSELFYSVKGKGEPLVLLHGFLEDSQIWEPFLNDLQERYQVFCLDLFGHGQSETFGTEHTMEHMAEALFELLVAYNVKTAQIIGHSLGGYVALAFAEQHPEMLKKIVLLNSSPRADSAERKQNRDRAIRLLKSQKDAFIKMAIKNLFTPETLDRLESEIELLVKRALKMSPEAVIASVQGMKNRSDRTQVLREFQGEKYMVVGKRDPIMELEEMEGVASETQTELHLFPNGHMSYLEDQREFEHFLKNTF